MTALAAVASWATVGLVVSCVLTPAPSSLGDVPEYAAHLAFGAMLWPVKLAVWALDTEVRS